MLAGELDQGAGQRALELSWEPAMCLRPGLRGSRCGGQGGLLGLIEEEHHVPFLHGWEGALQVMSWFPQMWSQLVPRNMGDLRAMLQGAHNG